MEREIKIFKVYKLDHDFQLRVYSRRTHIGATQIPIFIRFILYGALRTSTALSLLFDDVHRTV